MADKRVKYIADDGPFCEVGITGKQTSWRRNQSGFVTEANAALLIASGKFVLSSTAFATDADGLDSHLSEHAAIGSPIIKKFPTWPANAGILLASLVASSTSSRTSNVVTISAAAHGITTGTTYVGYRFYYPGSPSLVAGWYDSILTIPDANTITFYASGTDFGSESVNFGAALVTYTDFATIPLPARTLNDGSIVTLVCYRDGGGTPVFKYVSLYLSNSALVINYNTTSPKSLYRSGFICIGTAKQIATQSSTDNTPSTALYTTTKDITVDQIITLKGQVTGAGDFIAIGHAHLEIIQ